MDPWDKLGTGATLRRGPPRLLLAKETPIGKLKTSPEVVEHMVEDLEDKLKHYFNLYVKEKKDREVEQEKNLMLVEKIKQLCTELDIKDKRLCELEHKIKELFVNPQNIKDTLDRIDLIYIHLDTLIQAFIGIGTCATLNGLNKHIFTKIALEYLHPCRNLDSRLDALYSALYSLLLTSNTNEGFFGQSNTVALEGFYVVIAEISFDNNPNVTIPNQIQLGLRYDHEEPVKMVSLDVINGLCQVNMEKHLNLPPKKPGKIPKFAIDIWFEATSDMASAKTSLIDPILLEQYGQWPLMVNDLKIGVAKVTVNPYPINARMPAERFRAAKEFAHVQKGARPIIDYHLLQPPMNTNESQVERLGTQQPSIYKGGMSKSVVTIKVDNNCKSDKDDDINNRTNTDNNKGTNRTNDADIKPKTQFVPKKQPLRKNMGRPVPRKTTPLKPKPTEVNKEDGGIIKTIIESQPEKVASIDQKPQVDDVKQKNVEDIPVNNAVTAVEDVKVKKDDVPIVNDVLPNVQNDVSVVDNAVQAMDDMVPPVQDEQPLKNADNVEKSEETPIVRVESRAKVVPPKIIVEKKLSTKLSNANMSRKDSGVDVNNDSLSDTIIKPKKIPLDINKSSDNDNNVEGGTRRRPKQVQLIPLAKPIMLTKNHPV